MLHRMIWRRACIVTLAILFLAALVLPLWLTLAPGGWTAPKFVMLLGFAGAAPWLGLCGANGVCGALVGWGDAAARCPPGQAGDAPPCAPHGMPPATAIAVAVRNEEIGAVLSHLQRLMTALDHTGTGAAFTPWILSDTTDPDLARAEDAAVAQASLPRLRYRRRAINTGHKAGNIMAFLDQQGSQFDAVVILDADSRMTAAAVLRLVRTLQAEPRLGIVQHLTVGLPARSGFARLFQFGMRAGMRSWARSVAWWQGDEACYWGHNAALRVAPFRHHGRLAPLPDGSTILSHDQVEAAQLAAAGWGVRLLPEEDGSFEANPPALPEFLRRELRWLAGNLQYWPLIRRSRLRPMGRWQLVQAILLFISVPFYAVFLAGAALAAAADHASPFPAGPALTLTIGWLSVLYAPKWLSYAALLGSARERQRYGGARRVLAGMLAETAFTLLMDPVATVAKSVGTLRLACGLRPGWLPQNRLARAVLWREAIRLLWPQTALGVAAFAAFASAGPVAVLWAAPLAGGLLLSIPLCVLTADPAFGAWLCRRGIAATPEEVAAGAPIGSESEDVTAENRV